MRFLYKIHSGYDGFRPAKIPERLDAGERLVLGWRRYLDAANRDDEVWVYFRGPHRFEDSVYVKGRIDSIDFTKENVSLRVDDYDSERPIVDSEAASRIAEVVSRRYQQVFVWPEHWESADCDVFGSRESCEAKRCGLCAKWGGYPTVDEKGLSPLSKLRGSGLATIAPAYWARPTRCYLAKRRLKASVLEITDLITDFKLGNGLLAFPFSLGMHEALRTRNLVEFDAIVPVPLSPDKAARGELHRTRVLAKELSELLHCPVAEVVTLTGPISKRRHLAGGSSYASFQARYESLLSVDPRARRLRRVLIVDDVCTYGGTLRAVARALRAAGAGTTRLVATAAAQMVVKDALGDESVVAIPGA